MTLIDHVAADPGKNTRSAAIIKSFKFTLTLLAFHSKAKNLGESKLTTYFWSWNFAPKSVTVIHFCRLLDHLVPRKLKLYVIEWLR